MRDDWEQRKLDFARNMHALLRKNPMAKRKEKSTGQDELPVMSDVLPAAEAPELTRIYKPGYYNMDMRSYIADPCPEPSMSKSTVQDIHYRTLLRAHDRHPKLGGADSPDATRADIGSAIHAGAFGGRPLTYAPAEFQDWRKDAAQDFRRLAYDAWKIPLLAKQKTFIEDSVGKVKEIIAAEFGELVCERTQCWQLDVGGGRKVWMRGREDGGNDDVDVDLKSATNANPIEWGKFAAIRGGYDIQAALRERGHVELRGRPKEMWWLIIEFERPYDHAVQRVAESMLSIGRQKIDNAAPKWRDALDSGKFPTYGRGILQASSRAEWDLQEQMNGGTE